MTVNLRMTENYELLTYEEESLHILPSSQPLCYQELSTCPPNKVYVYRVHFSPTLPLIQDSEMLDHGQTQENSQVPVIRELQKVKVSNKVFAD